MAETFDELFSRAVELAGGSETKLAAAAGCSQNAIWSAKRAGRFSGELAIKIERATKSAVPRWKLRPDLWDDPAPGQGAAA